MKSINQIDETYQNRFMEIETIQKSSTTELSETVERVNDKLSSTVITLKDSILSEVDSRLVVTKEENLGKIQEASTKASDEVERLNLQIRDLIESTSQKLATKDETMETSLIEKINNQGTIIDDFKLRIDKEFKQLQEFEEKRFQQFEVQTEKSIANSQSTQEKALNVVESYVKKSIDTIASQQQQFEQNVNTKIVALQDKSNTLSSHTTQLQNEQGSLSKSIVELKDSMIQDVKKVNDNLSLKIQGVQDYHEESLQSFDSKIKELKKHMTAELLEQKKAFDLSIKTVQSELGGFRAQLDSTLKEVNDSLRNTTNLLDLTKGEVKSMQDKQEELVKRQAEELASQKTFVLDTMNSTKEQLKTNQLEYKNDLKEVIVDTKQELKLNYQDVKDAQKQMKLDFIESINDVKEKQHISINDLKEKQQANVILMKKQLATTKDEFNEHLVKMEEHLDSSLKHLEFSIKSEHVEIQNKQEEKLGELETRVLAAIPKSEFEALQKEVVVIKQNEKVMQDLLSELHEHRQVMLQAGEESEQKQEEEPVEEDDGELLNTFQKLRKRVKDLTKQRDYSQQLIQKLGQELNTQAKAHNELQDSFTQFHSMIMKQFGDVLQMDPIKRRGDSIEVDEGWTEKFFDAQVEARIGSPFDEHMEAMDKDYGSLDYKIEEGINKNLRKIIFSDQISNRIQNEVRRFSSSPDASYRPSSTIHVSYGDSQVNQEGDTEFYDLDAVLDTENEEVGEGGPNPLEVAYGKELEEEALYEKELDAIMNSVDDQDLNVPIESLSHSDLIDDDDEEDL
eukprot:CAMPEP_0117420724 /NCGR_PEP_ID=MMETSP0758-20121206/1995_1 /TAXON_ID=63605 /ORGANISM="Percolomonas cosmopolitus, Strain AE-1 (ATCC 50343)" /LENGTH=792 /DNA_ID=CAMNT_0005202493 /DNA_START=347 /DNA_END=2725 /DNA_ORIENTATION=+